MYEENATKWLPSLVTASQIPLDRIFDTIVLVDTCSSHRVAHASPWLPKASRVICIDHHPLGGDDYSPLASRWLVPWGACSSVITAIIAASLDPLNPLSPADLESALLRASPDSVSSRVSSDVATLLLLGQHCDTGSFALSSSRSCDLVSASHLMRCSPHLSVVWRHLQRSTPSALNLAPPMPSLLRQLISSAQIHEFKSGLPVAVGLASSDEECRTLAPLAQLCLQELPCVAFFLVASCAAAPIAVVGRSLETSGVDCGAVCRALGGGGHPCAAAASLSSSSHTLVTAKERLFAVLRTQLAGSPSVRALMTPSVVFIPFDATVTDAVRIMLERTLKKAPCLGADGKPAGLLDRMSVDRAVRLGLGDHKASEFAQALPPWLSPDASLDAAVDLLLRENARVVLVRQDATSPVIGIVSRSDVVSHLMKDPVLQTPRVAAGERVTTVQLKGKAPPKMVQFLQQAGVLADEMHLDLYVVGGFPRDVLLDRPNDDIDLVVSGGEAIAFARALHAQHGDPKVPVLEHEAFHTAVVTLLTGEKIDVATARLEYYPLPASLPVVEMSSLKMDLARRDFSINALAIQLNKNSFGNVVDFFHSRRDIEAKCINVLHTLSFVEDPTRIFRASRFACRFGFHLTPVTVRLLKHAVENSVTSKLTGTRVFHELEKIFAESDPVSCFAMLVDHGALKCIHPALQQTFRLDRLREAVDVARWYQELDQTPHYWWKSYLMTMCWRLSKEDFAEVVSRLMLPHTKVGELEQAFGQAHLAVTQVRNWLKENGPRSALYNLFKPLALETIVAVCGILRSKREDWQRVSIYLTTLRTTTTALTGNDLKVLGIKPGPVFAELLSALMNAVLDDKVTGDKEAQLAWVKDYYKVHSTK